jgi:Na+/H+ antiporter NhaD/arsenite permease-like protein
VLAGAFNIKFIDYTANMIVPVIITAIVLFPFLLYIVFANEELIPLAIEMHELSEEAQARPAVNPNIPNARGAAEEEENRRANGDQRQLLSLEEIMNPFLDKRGALVGAVVMAVTLIAVLVLNAVSDIIGRIPVYYITLPAAVLMLLWDLSYGWLHRHETREIARKGREEIELAQLQRALEEEQAVRQTNSEQGFQQETSPQRPRGQEKRGDPAESVPASNLGNTPANVSTTPEWRTVPATEAAMTRAQNGDIAQHDKETGSSERTASNEPDGEKRVGDHQVPVMAEQGGQQHAGKATLMSLCRRGYRWSQETFPTVTAVLSHLPFALVPFAFTMFILVQGLVSTGWVPVFAYGWDHWVNKTGTLGAIGGMAFLSVVLCNVSQPNYSSS